MFRKLLCGLAVIASAGCSPNAGTREISFGKTAGLSTTGSIRIITERARYGMPNVVCIEPSPDYAVAFSTNRSVTVNVPANVTRQQSVQGQATSNETIVQPSQGRSEAVTALRDGLSTACQSYANGVIGHDAYAIILSQYGVLLTQLIGNNPKPGESAGAAGAQQTRQSALSALMVACISSYDRTRVGGPTNPLLDPAFCKSVLRTALPHS